MMLPGVESARRRRVHHHHEIQARGPPEPTVSRPSVFHPTVMDESVIVARRRLEEKLRRFSVPSPPSSSPSAPSLNLSTSRPRGESSSSCGGVAIPEIGSTAVGIGSQRSKRHEMKSSVGSRTELCAVCLDDFVVQQTFVRLPCSHKYHSECLLPWLAAHSHCPCCRTIVPSLNLLL